MSLEFQLCLDEREDARVFATVILIPTSTDLSLDGVALQLCDADGNTLSPKRLLPVSGQLLGPVSSRVELRSNQGAIPAGAQVIATAWWPGGHLQAQRCTDPGTTLKEHVLAKGRIALTDEDVLLDVLPEERDIMVSLFPWVATQPNQRMLELEAQEDAHPCDDMGLDDEDAEWLKNLMDQ